MKTNFNRLLGNRIKPNTTTQFRKTNINMLQGIVNLSKDPKYVPVINSNVAFKEAMILIEKQLNDLISLRAEAKSALAGQSAAKRVAKEQFVIQSLFIMQSAYSYAISINDQALAGRLRTSKSALMYAGTPELNTIIEAAITTIQPIVTELAGYNITPAVFTAWQTAFAAYRVEGVAPTEAVNFRKATNKDIQLLFASIMSNIYERADTLAYSFATSYPSFFQVYRAARKLKPVGHISTQLRATITDELNQPIANAEIQISGTDLTAITDEKGYASISDIPFGKYSVIVINGKTSTEFGPFDFKKGHSLTQHFTVAPSFAPAAKTTVENQEETVK